MAKVMITALMRGGGAASVFLEVELPWNRHDVDGRQPEKDELPHELLTLQISNETRGMFAYNRPIPIKNDEK